MIVVWRLLSACLLTVLCLVSVSAPSWADHAPDCLVTPQDPECTTPTASPTPEPLPSPSPSPTPTASPDPSTTPAEATVVVVDSSQWELFLAGFGVLLFFVVLHVVASFGRGSSRG